MLESWEAVVTSIVGAVAVVLVELVDADAVFVLLGISVSLQLFRGEVVDGDGIFPCLGMSVSLQLFLGEDASSCVANEPCGDEVGDDGRCGTHVGVVGYRRAIVDGS